MELLSIIVQTPHNSGEQYSGIIMMIIIVIVVYFALQIIKKNASKEKTMNSNEIDNSINIVNQQINKNMNEEIKCPQCGGNRTQDLGANKYKCMYCGTVFSPAPRQNQNSNSVPPATGNSIPTPPTGQQIINVNVGSTSSQQRESAGKDFARGAAGGAGLALGGCLTGGLISILAPILGILFALYCVVSCVQSCA